MKYTLVIMNLFYTPDIKGDYYILSPEESKHCLRVLRMGAGDSLVLVDGQGGWYEGVIEDANVKGCGVRICRVQEHYGQRPFRVHLAIAPTKNMDRMEWMLEKCTEMGIEVITLLETAHSERKVVRMDRLEKVAVSAMKQSQKAYLPELRAVSVFRQFVSDCTERYKFIAHCHAGEKKRLDEVYVPGEDALVLIGPEGDFSTEEVVFAQAHGFVPITLGVSRLRTETAGMVACHSINFMNKV